VLDQSAGGDEDQSVVTSVKVRFTDQIGDLVPGTIIQQQTAQQGLFSLQGVRGDFLTIAAEFNRVCRWHRFRHRPSALLIIGKKKTYRMEY
jgi:hypothetical protein